MSASIKPPVDIYSALADATRCRIVELLASVAMPVHRLTEAFLISRPAISRHLRVLKQAGLVAEVKKGRENLYALRPAKLAKAAHWLEAYGAPSPAKDSAPAAHTPDPAPVPTPIMVTPPVEPKQVEETIPVKQVALRTKKPAPVNQMGFDF